MQSADKHLIKSSDVPSKRERQEAFVSACKKEGLSAEKIVERASVFPVDEKSRVLKWPKL